MKYHAGPRFGLSEKEQSKVYWTCVTYESESEIVRSAIDRLCEEIGGQYKDLLFRTITSTESLTSIARSEMNCPVDESGLYRLVKKFYMQFISCK